MDLLDIANTLKALNESNTNDTYARELGFVHLTLTVDQWDAVQKLISMLQLADLVNYKKAQDSFPRLLNAVKLVLAIADHPEQNPTEKISLAPKTRAQLDSAVKFAENK
jgi:hypothetical protein